MSARPDCANCSDGIKEKSVKFEPMQQKEQLKNKFNVHMFRLMPMVFRWIQYVHMRVYFDGAGRRLSAFTQCQRK